MNKPADSPYLVSFDGDFKVSRAATAPPKGAPDKAHCKKQLKKIIKQLSDYQRVLYAHDHHAILLVFQAMDAAGKDSTIRAVMSGINPAGCEVYSFKQPSEIELDHDFLWRTTCRLPQRGRMGIFNRSYYEEVLVVRVHPEYLEPQRIPNLKVNEEFWRQRLESIIDLEKHLARNGTVILKFWLNVSRKEQRQRFISRLEEPEKYWKFSEKDLAESDLWNRYMNAYEQAIKATSKPWAPWYAIPADSKSYMRLCVAEILLKTFEGMKLRYPKLSADEIARFQKLKDKLVKVNEKD